MSEAPDGPDIKAALSKRIGPLPLGGWLLAVAGGLGISWWIRNNGDSGQTGEPMDPGSITTAGGTPVGMGGAAVSDPAYPGNTTGPTDPDNAGTGTTGTAITTNGQWRQQAIKYLVGAGLSGIFAERTVTKYLAGQPLVDWEAKRISAALAAIGPTPVAVPPVRLVAPTGNAVTPPKPTFNTNAAWRTAAIKWLVAHGSPLTGSTTVVNNYLLGKPNGAAGTASLNRCIAAIGKPPQPIVTHSPIAHVTAPTIGTHSTVVASPTTTRDTGTA